MNRILFVPLFLAAVLGFVTPAAAQVTFDSIDSGAEAGVEVSSVPYVYLSNIKFDKKLYKAGENVSMSLIAQNLSNEYLPSLAYKLTLLTLDANGTQWIVKSCRVKVN